MTIIHTSTYKFIPLQDLNLWQKKFSGWGEQYQAKGTILLAPEGINISIAAEEANLQGFKNELAKLPEFNDLFYKDSLSSQMPFKKYCVKIKEEIIPLRKGAFTFEKNPEHTLSPEQLKQWLDEGVDFELFDTRNVYETGIGTFEKAKVVPLRYFRDFPEVFEQHTDPDKLKPRVIFCTGGVRCDKALPLLLQMGYPNVYQLEGGIINYFQKCGGAHYRGECFVFDERISLNPELHETDTKLCQICQFPMTGEEQEAGHVCPPEI